jgi:glutamyl/glutaminyl-tRNA synthetase
MSIDIDSIKVKKNKDHKNIVKLDDTYSMKLKYPSFDQFIDNNFEVSGTSSDVSKSLDMITSCIEMVYNEEESWEASDCSKKELTEFVDQLNSKQFKEIENFFTTMPKLSHLITVKNPNTGVESEVVLEGLASFFS